MTFLGEIAYTDGNLMPELSFGTHFFQDLVETSIFYLAIFPENPEVIFHRSILDRFENVLETLVPGNQKYQDVIKVYEAGKQGLRIMADIVSQKLICFV